MERAAPLEKKDEMRPCLFPYPALRVCKYKDHPIRVIVEPDGTPLYVGLDIGRAVGYKNPGFAVGKHCGEIALHRTVPTPDGNRPVRALTALGVVQFLNASTFADAGPLKAFMQNKIFPAALQRVQPPTSPLQPIKVIYLGRQKAGARYSLYYKRNLNTPIEVDAEAIKRARYRAQHSQVTAAACVYVSLSTWKSWEQGNRKIPYAMMELYLLKTRQLSLSFLVETQRTQPKRYDWQ